MTESDSAGQQHRNQPTFGSDQPPGYGPGYVQPSHPQPPVDPEPGYRPQPGDDPQPGYGTGPGSGTAPGYGTDPGSGVQPVPPAYDQPAYGQSPYFQSPYGQPAFGEPAFDQSPFDQPAFDQSPYGQAAYGQPPYGQERFGQPVFGEPVYGQQPPYGQPVYGQQPGGFAPYAPGNDFGAPTPAKPWIQRFWPWIAGFVGVIVVLAVVGALNGGSENPGSNHTLSAPEQSGSYTRQNGALADRVAASISTSFSGSYAASDIRTGVYGPSGSAQPEFIFFGVHTSELADHSRDTTLDSFLKGAKVTSASKFDPGPLGGEMRCGLSPAGQTTCVWVDHNTLGALVFGSLTGTSAADTTRTFRGDAEK